MHVNCTMSVSEKYEDTSLTTVFNFPPPPKLKIIKGKMTWKEIEKRCTAVKGRLMVIDNKEKQLEAVKIARRSGLERIAIGVYIKGLTWYYSDVSEVNYTNWVPNQYSGFFAALSKKHNYQWLCILYTYVDGGLCEKL